ncbi:MAG: cytochrome c [Firmicutes bacterium]|nr:cytochrome c [Bacillota bacterium]MCL5040661.1 cytochrome c [Bacillota bacterium]
MRWLVYSLVFLILLGFALLTLDTMRRVAVVGMTPEAIEGKRVWQRYGCVDCHMIFGNGDYSSADLTRVTSRYGIGWLEDYLTSGPLLPQSKGKRHPAVKREEAKVLVAFFAAIAKIGTGAWPPQPLPVRSQGQDTGN